MSAAESIDQGSRGSILLICGIGVLGATGALLTGWLVDRIGDKPGGDWRRPVVNIAVVGTVMWVLLWLVIHRFSSAGAHDSVRPRISVAH